MTDARSNRTANPEPVGGYRQASDLPALKKADQDLKAAAPFGGIGPEYRSMLEGIAKLRTEIGESIDGFYRLVGGSGWIFLDRFNVAEVNERVATHDPAGLEGDVVAWFLQPANLGVLASRAKARPEISGRGELVELAVQDTLEGRYYSAVLVLLAVCDGMISDMERGNRKGLHARDPERMVAWGSPVGHRDGLPAALKMYGTPFGKVFDDEVTNLYRHGIVHGMVPRFNNAHVSGKAWSLLAGLLEWAAAEELANKPAAQRVTLGELTTKLRRNEHTRKSLETWSSRAWRRDSPEGPVPAEPVLDAATELFDGWQHCRWGVISQRVDPLGHVASPKRFAQEIKSRFEPVPIESWTLTGFEFVSPLSADVSCDFVVGNEVIKSRTKWFYKDPDGKHLNEFDEGGTWRCIQDYPDEILRVPPS